jgi:hypothetical protein
VGLSRDFSLNLLSEASHHFDSGVSDDLLLVDKRFNMAELEDASTCLREKSEQVIDDFFVIAGLNQVIKHIFVSRTAIVNRLLQVELP